MGIETPATAAELAQALASAAANSQTILLGGASTKDAMGGPIADPGVTVSTKALNRILKYEPRDLTISVEAGMKFSDLEQALAEHGQMLPLDPGHHADCTVGGVLAANISGPRRRLYGTARDMVIGMQFATLEGKLVQSGGMVVKNVAGLDMAKIMIGSFGTLAAIVVANFKVVPKPPATRTFLLGFDSLEAAIRKRNDILGSVLQPAAIDLLNPQGAARSGRSGWVLAVEAGGSSAVLARYARELNATESIEGEEERRFWSAVIEFAPTFLREHPEGAVVRIPSTLTGLEEVLAAIHTPALARAASGTVYACFEDCDAASEWLRAAVARNWKAVIESAPKDQKPRLELWPCPGDDLATMRRVKQMFDPAGLLNPGRLYGRI